MLAVYASGQDTIWDDSNFYRSYPRSAPGSNASRAAPTRGCGNLLASTTSFLYERNTVAVVWDATARPSVGRLLHIFDSREAHSYFHTSWSTTLNNQFEIRCTSLLEDQLQVVTENWTGHIYYWLENKTSHCEVARTLRWVYMFSCWGPRWRALV